MEMRISVIVPCYNSASTVGTCLEALFESTYGNFEVVAVDDCSKDGSDDIIRQFPCRLVSLETHSGASKARNAGAWSSSGDILFFIDADCVVFPDTLSLVHEAFMTAKDALIGGTYTPIAFDDTFFSTFQSLFVHYSETKKKEPDYIATHAMIISRSLFEQSRGFPEDFLPILEDVEFSHRLRSQGCRLIMFPEIRVRHIFNFTPLKSLKNAFRKSRYWTAYSMQNKDLLKDSGTASIELKVNVLCWFFSICLIAASLSFSVPGLLVMVVLSIIFNGLINRNLFKAFFRTKGLPFGLGAVFYYMTVYPIPVAAGSLAGMTSRFLQY